MNIAVAAAVLVVAVGADIFVLAVLQLSLLMIANKLF